MGNSFSPEAMKFEYIILVFCPKQMKAMYQFLIFFPKNYIYFMLWRHGDEFLHVLYQKIIFVSVPINGCFGTLNSYLYQKNNGHFQTQLLNFIQIAKTPLLFGQRQKWMIPSCCLWKVVTFFGKEHVNWSSISRVMIRR